MQAPLELLMFMFAVDGAWLAALFAFLGPPRVLLNFCERKLRSYAAPSKIKGRLRQELNQSLKGFQELTVAAVGGLGEGMEGQVRGFGERLDAGINDRRPSRTMTLGRCDLKPMLAVRCCGPSSNKSLITARGGSPRQPRASATNSGATFSAWAAVCPDRWVRRAGSKGERFGIASNVGVLCPVTAACIQAPSPRPAPLARRPFPNPNGAPQTSGRI